MVTDWASDRANDATQNMATAIADATGNVVKTLGTFWVNVGTPNLTASPGGSDASDPVMFLQNSLWFWTAALAVLSVLVGAAKMIIERRGTPMRDLGRSLATLVVVSGAGVGAVGLLTVAADQFSVWIIENSTGKSFNENITHMLLITAQGPLGSIMIILLGLIAILASVIQIVLMIVRGGLLVVLTGIFPTAAAFTNTEAGKGWFQKCCAWLIAFILYKPAAAIIYATAFRLTDTNVFGSFGNGEEFGSALVTVITGLALMVIALFAMPALMRFVTPMVGAAVGGGGGALAAGAVAGLASGAVNMGMSGRGGGGQSSNSSPPPAGQKDSGQDPSGTAGQGDAGSTGTAGKSGGPGNNASAPAASGAETASAGGGAAASGGAAGGGAAAAGPAGIAVAAGVQAGQAAAGAAKQMSEDSTGGA